MKATRKVQKQWICGIIESMDADEISNRNPYTVTAENIRACSRNSRGGNYYGTEQAAAEHFLRGVGLSGFPFYDDDQAAQLAAWGYDPTPRMIANFWTVSAGLLVEVLREHGQIID